MDERSDPGATGEPCSLRDELEGVFSDPEFNLRELAMELGEKPAPPKAPKPPPPGR